MSDNAGAERAFDLLAAEVLRRVEVPLRKLIEDARKPDRGLTAAEARKMLGIGATKWHELRKTRELPEPNVAGTYSERELSEFIARKWQPYSRRRGRR
jgi:hypothetical protein